VSALVLASSSAYRAQLLARLGIEFETATPAIDETPLPGEAPRALVLRLAEMKARAVARRYPQALIIGSDQVAVSGTSADTQTGGSGTGAAQSILGKPGTATRAAAQLAELSGQSVQFLTSLCLFNSETGNLQLSVSITPVTFRALTRDEIVRYVEREQPLDCAGAFKSEGLGIALLASVGGDDPNALIGLPLISLCTMLRAEGISVLA